MISTLVIVGLALVWAAVLLPDLVAKVSRGRRSDTIRSFNTQLSSLGRSAPIDGDDNVIDLRARKTTHRRSVRNSTGTLPGVQSPYVGSVISTPVAADRGAGAHRRPQRSSRAAVTGPRAVSPALRKRRQDVLIALGAGALLTLLATVAFGGMFLYLHLVADLLMAAYLVALQRVVTDQGAHTVASEARPDRAPDRAMVSTIGTRSAFGGSVGGRSRSARSLAGQSLEVQQIAN